MVDAGHVVGYRENSLDDHASFGFGEAGKIQDVFGDGPRPFGLAKSFASCPALAPR
jgi:hypothetical protein